jgi:hypothetical protein
MAASSLTPGCLTPRRFEGGTGTCLSGDVGEAPTVAGYLQELGRAVSTSLYFVVGNHDFYRRSFRGALADVDAHSRRDERLVLLTGVGTNSQTPLI